MQEQQYQQPPPGPNVRSVRRFIYVKQKQDGSQIKELSNASDVSLLLLSFGKNSLLKIS